MLSPRAVARRLVVDASQELKDLWGNLGGGDSELLVELALGGAADTLDGLWKRGSSLGGDLKGVRAAGVGPHAFAQSAIALYAPRAGSGTDRRR